MKMLGVTIPGTHLVKPAAISSGLAAQRLLDRGIERGGPGNGVNLRANSSLAGVDSASGFFSGGRGLGLSEPGSIRSIKCFSCATAELAAARKRTASRQTTARISNIIPGRNTLVGRTALEGRTVHIDPHTGRGPTNRAASTSGAGLALWQADD
jgi:hypothetical protein